MARRKPKQDGIDALLALPWWLSFALAAVAYLTVAFVFPATLPVGSPLRAGLTPVLKVLGAVLAGLLCLIGAAAWFKQRQAGAPRTSLSPRHDPVQVRSTAEPTARAAVRPAAPDPLDEIARIRADRQLAPPVAEARPAAWSMEVLRRMEWKRFEHVVAGYYERVGFRAQLQDSGADGGVDVRLYRGEAGKPLALVQCKAWQAGAAVGVKPVRELLGVMTIEQVNAGIFVTTSGYTDDAKALSGAHRLKLIDGDELLQMIRALPAAAQTELLALATEGDWTTPTCPSCGTKMIRRERRSDQSAFWGCPSFPACRQVFALRSDV
jgi:restriction system protein